MPAWNAAYYETLRDRFSAITDGLDERLEDVVDGTIAPAVEDITIGSARKLRAATLFFDIRNFSSRTTTVGNMKKALQMLDCVIPMVEHIVYDHGGYVEKNTGDGVLAVVAADDDGDAANTALDIGTASLYLLQNMINEYLESAGIERVDARVGIDLGTLLLARIGTPKGSARQARSFLTAVGPSVNLASRLQQEMADTNEIWVGDLIKTNAAAYRKDWFTNMTPEGWTWSYLNDRSRTYHIWKYTGRKVDPE